LANGPVSWSVTADFAPPCGPLTSATGNYNSCDSSLKTIPSIIAAADAGQSYTLQWDQGAGASKYEVDESTTESVAVGTFTTPSANTNSVSDQQTVRATTALVYRVRAFVPCANGLGPNPVSVRIVLSPVTVPSIPNVGEPAGSNPLIPIVVHVNGFPEGTFPF